ncbi:hypothetical protein BKH42_06855 [Helicobacter sp. 13S00482-2]|uniref:phage holin family protein n=1 Tax=Helicobacter sp. 13S00482-2 TaxID=1476200 RepID=UPI000BA4FEAA|nr:phage holin family protein [Helicobacter sp. 13S00482-2]PAF53241.1 hypothetical protein BKH42_06855 [Helicobacter sp. 13S00482-2]
MNLLDLMRTYIFVALIGLFVGCLFVLRTISEEVIDTKSKMIQFIIYGVGSSMLITWIGYEIFVFYGLPPSLACSIGGGLGFIGAETIARIFIRFLKKKLDIKEEE